MISRGIKIFITIILSLIIIFVVLYAARVINLDKLFVNKTEEVDIDSQKNEFIKQMSKYPPADEAQKQEFIEQMNKYPTIEEFDEIANQKKQEFIEQMSKY